MPEDAPVTTTTDELDMVFSFDLNEW